MRYTSKKHSLITVFSLIAILLAGTFFLFGRSAEVRAEDVIPEPNIRIELVDEDGVPLPGAMFYINFKDADGGEQGRPWMAEEGSAVYTGEISPKDGERLYPDTDYYMTEWDLYEGYGMEVKIPEGYYSLDGENGTAEWPYAVRITKNYNAGPVLAEGSPSFDVLTPGTGKKVLESSNGNGYSIEIPEEGYRDIIGFEVDITEGSLLGGAAFIVQNHAKTVEIPIKKVDALTGKELEGAEFSITGTKKNGKKIGEDLPEITWKSGDEKFPELSAGSYSLKETAAPAGYEAATESVDFEVILTDGEPVLQVGGSTAEEIVFENGLKTYEIKIRKTDEQDADLPGAKLVVSGTDIAGTEIAKEEFTSAEEAKTLKLAAGKYELEETEAPEGYEKADKIAFSVDADGKLTVDGAEADEVKMVNKKTPEPEPEPEPKTDQEPEPEPEPKTEPSSDQKETETTPEKTPEAPSTTPKAPAKSPKTGDAGTLPLWAHLLGASAAGLAAARHRRKKS